MSAWPIYDGVLDRDKMPKEARIAYESYWSQVRKCRDVNNRWFRYYGGKGVSVKYGPREFIGWWLENKKTFTGKRATTGRIDHDGDYCFENITMQDVSENSRECILRNNSHYKQLRGFGLKVLCCHPDGKPFVTFLSIRSAASYFGVSQRLVQFIVRGKYRQSKKLGMHLFPQERSA